jgi:hypothetical protein
MGAEAEPAANRLAGRHLLAPGERQGPPGAAVKQASLPPRFLRKGSAAAH